jgi:threonine/homoserine/homoserine lactone efflux protein
MCAITWHWFDNDPKLDWVVTAQASLTLLGNCTLAWAAYRIWRAERADEPAQEGDPD